jgi:hypothetical protein
MTVEILYFDGCPNYEPLLARLPALLADAGIDAEVVARRVRSERAAQELRLLGSPTVRVDGRDVEAGAGERSDYGLKCRLYRTTDGIFGQPSDASIIAAVRAAGSARN